MKKVRGFAVFTLIIFCTLQANVSAGECERFGGVQMCWGTEILTPDPKAPHTAAFSFAFKLPFATTPTVTNGINVNGSGHGMTVYAWKVDSTSYQGRVNNMYIG